MIGEKRISKFLSLVLRHNPDLIDIVPDKNGWVDVNELLEKLKRQRLYVTSDELKNLVESNNKQRFAFSLDGKKIRANQGHSIEVDLGYQKKNPPNILFHGTAKKNLESIFTSGIYKMDRHHVHLSQDIYTARQVGERHGVSTILKIKSIEMAKNGFDFFLTENKVWLTDFVPVQFIEIDE